MKDAELVKGLELIVARIDAQRMRIAELEAHLRDSRDAIEQYAATNERLNAEIRAAEAELSVRRARFPGTFATAGGA